MGKVKIKTCFLEASNKTGIENGFLGELIRRQGKEHLWEDNRMKTDTVVIHYMSAVKKYPEDPFDFNNALEIFCDFGVSSHYLIDRSGAVYNLVPEEKKAWHCGPSIMPEPDNRTGVNDFSIGIELLATESSGFTESQYDSLSALCRDIESRYGKMSYVGHSDIAGERAVDLGLRTDVKIDPGDLFEWERFLDMLRNSA